jgi:hypothetical protein
VLFASGLTAGRKTSALVLVGGRGVAVDTTRARFLLPHTEFTGQGRSTGTKKSIKFTYNVYHVQYIQYIYRKLIFEREECKNTIE